MEIKGYLTTVIELNGLLGAVKCLKSKLFAIQVKSGG